MLVAITGAGVLGVTGLLCVLLFVAAFLAPRWSQKPQDRIERAFGKGEEHGGKAPGRLGEWLQKPFGKSREATGKTAAAGRRSRSKLRV